jgi:hypothetical protein
MTNPNEDHYGWAQETIEKLRQGRWEEVEIDYLLEELEEMAGSDRRELRNRLSVLLAHLLKWKYQPKRRGRSWIATIKEQRLMVQDVLEDNPSLRPQLPEIGSKAYRRAVQRAVKETDLDETTFPSTFEQTGWRWEQVLDMEYLPDLDPTSLE